MHAIGSFFSSSFSIRKKRRLRHSHFLSLRFSEAGVEFESDLAPQETVKWKDAPLELSGDGTTFKIGKNAFQSLSLNELTSSYYLARFRALPQSKPDGEFEAMKCTLSGTEKAVHLTLFGPLACVKAAASENRPSLFSLLSLKYVMRADPKGTAADVTTLRFFGNSSLRLKLGDKRDAFVKSVSSAYKRYFHNELPSVREDASAPQVPALADSAFTLFEEPVFRIPLALVKEGAYMRSKDVVRENPVLDAFSGQRVEAPQLPSPALRHIRLMASGCGYLVERNAARGLMRMIHLSALTKVVAPSDQPTLLELHFPHARPEICMYWCRSSVARDQLAVNILDAAIQFNARPKLLHFRLPEAYTQRGLGDKEEELLVRLCNETPTSHPLSLRAAVTLYLSIDERFPFMNKDTRFFSTVLTMLSEDNLQVDTGYPVARYLVLRVIACLLTARSKYEMVLKMPQGDRVAFLTKVTNTLKCSNVALISAALDVLRALVSFQWRPNQLGAGSSYEGRNSLATTGWSDMDLYEVQSEHIEFVSSSKGFMSTIGVHGRDEQGGKYVEAREKLEAMLRPVLLRKGPEFILPLISKFFVAGASANRSAFIKVPVLGIFEDFLLTRSHLDAKLPRKPDAELLALRKAVLTILEKNTAHFIGYTKTRCVPVRRAALSLLRSALIGREISESAASAVAWEIVCDGTFLSHILNIFSSPSKAEQRLSAQVMAAVTTKNKQARRVLLRAFPTPLLKILHSKRAAGTSPQPPALQNWPLDMNWPQFFVDLLGEYNEPTLIWHTDTRADLVHSLRREIRMLEDETKGAPNELEIAWNSEEFTVHYKCLREDICVSGFFLRALCRIAKQESTKKRRKGSSTPAHEAEVASQTAGAKDTSADSKKANSRVRLNIPSALNSVALEQTKLRQSFSSVVKKPEEFLSDLVSAFQSYPQWRNRLMIMETISLVQSRLLIGRPEPARELPAIKSVFIQSAQTGDLAMGGHALGFLLSVAKSSDGLREVIRPEIVSIWVRVFCFLPLLTPERERVATADNEGEGEIHDLIDIGLTPVPEKADRLAPGGSSLISYDTPGTPVPPEGGLAEEASVQFSFEETEESDDFDELDQPSVASFIPPLQETPTLPLSLKGRHELPYPHLVSPHPLVGRLAPTPPPFGTRGSSSIPILRCLSDATKRYSGVDKRGRLLAPVPLIKRILGNSSNLPILAALLLTDININAEITELSSSAGYLGDISQTASQIFGLVLEILTSLCANNSTIAPKLFKYGIASYLFAYAGNVNVKPIFELLALTHRQGAAQGSHLSGILPAPLIRAIDIKTPDELATIFISGIQDSDTVWTQQMRLHLIHAARSTLRPLIQQLTEMRDERIFPLSSFNAQDLLRPHPIGELVYSELRDELCIENFYVRMLVESDPAELKIPLKDAGRLLFGLQRALESSTRVEKILLLSSAIPIVTSVARNEVVAGKVEVRSLESTISEVQRLMENHASKYGGDGSTCLEKEGFRRPKFYLAKIETIKTAVGFFDEALAAAPRAFTKKISEMALPYPNVFRSLSTAKIEVMVSLLTSLSKIGRMLGVQASGETAGFLAKYFSAICVSVLSDTVAASRLPEERIPLLTAMVKALGPISRGDKMPPLAISACAVGIIAIVYSSAKALREFGASRFGDPATYDQEYSSEQNAGTSQQLHALAFPRELTPPCVECFAYLVRFLSGSANALGTLAPHIDESGCVQVLLYALLILRSVIYFDGEPSEDVSKDLTREATSFSPSDTPGTSFVKCAFLAFEALSKIQKNQLFTQTLQDALSPSLFVLLSDAYTGFSQFARAVGSTKVSPFLIMNDRVYAAVLATLSESFIIAGRQLSSVDGSSEADTAQLEHVLPNSSQLRLSHADINPHHLMIGGVFVTVLLDHAVRGGAFRNPKFKSFPSHLNAADFVKSLIEFVAAPGRESDQMLTALLTLALLAGPRPEAVFPSVIDASKESTLLLLALEKLPTMSSSGATLSLLLRTVVHGPTASACVDQLTSPVLLAALAHLITSERLHWSRSAETWHNAQLVQRAALSLLSRLTALSNVVSSWVFGTGLWVCLLQVLLSAPDMNKDTVGEFCTIFSCLLRDEDICEDVVDQLLLVVPFHLVAAFVRTDADAVSLMLRQGVSLPECVWSQQIRDSHVAHLKVIVREVLEGIRADPFDYAFPGFGPAPNEREPPKMYGIDPADVVCGVHVSVLLGRIAALPADQVGQSAIPLRDPLGMALGLVERAARAVPAKLSLDQLRFFIVPMSYFVRTYPEAVALVANHDDFPSFLAVCLAGPTLASASLAVHTHEVLARLALTKVVPPLIPAEAVERRVLALHRLSTAGNANVKMQSSMVTSAPRLSEDTAVAVMAFLLNLLTNPATVAATVLDEIITERWSVVHDAAATAVGVDPESESSDFFGGGGAPMLKFGNESDVHALDVRAAKGPAIVEYSVTPLFVFFVMASAPGPDLPRRCAQYAEHLVLELIEADARVRAGFEKLSRDGPAAFAGRRHPRLSAKEPKQLDQSVPVRVGAQPPTDAQVDAVCSLEGETAPKAVLPPCGPTPVTFISSIKESFVNDNSTEIAEQLLGEILLAPPAMPQSPDPFQF